MGKLLNQFQLDRKSGDFAAVQIMLEEADNAHDALVAALEKATHELNAIRARDGAPLCIQWGPNGPMQSFQCSEDYFYDLVDECHAALEKAKP
ncbi:hypothetical protein LCGC14_2081400 [marine sediment metagenome]|uniref:Uncharacterized protein n=1 Tax=marine sediment metagenome TaxID=412755 RepID=A0A0F9GTX1_9ZZZZ